MILITQGKQWITTSVLPTTDVGQNNREILWTTTGKKGVPGVADASKTHHTVIMSHKSSKDKDYQYIDPHQVLFWFNCFWLKNSTLLTYLYISLGLKVNCVLEQYLPI